MIRNAASLRSTAHASRAYLAIEEHGDRRGLIAPDHRLDVLADGLAEDCRARLRGGVVADGEQGEGFTHDQPSARIDGHAGRDLALGPRE